MRYSIFLAIILLINAISSCSQGGGESKTPTGNMKDSTIVRPDKQRVSVIVLRYGDFNKEIISNGKLFALEKADLKFRSSENVDTVFVKNGDRVEKGQAIAKLDNFKLIGTLKQNLIQLEKAKVDLLDVIMSLGYSNTDTSLIPDVIMKTARARSGIDKAQSDLEMAEYNLRASSLISPFSGVVANLFSKENNLSSQGERFCTIINDNQFEAEFPILENELGSVRKGQTIRIIPYSFSDVTIKGVINKINPIVDQNGMVKVNAVCSNTGHNLFEGMNIKIILEERVPHQLVIPKQAVVLRSEKQVVFTYKNGKANWVYVLTGLENISSFIITSGLQEGDSIIYEGNLNLAHDAAVVINEELQK